MPNFLIIIFLFLNTFSNVLSVDRIRYREVQVPFATPKELITEDMIIVHTSKDVCDVTIYPGGYIGKTSGGYIVTLVPYNTENVFASAVCD